MKDFTQLSSRVSCFAESATLALAARAKKMAASGKDIINFSVGEPDFNTPKSIIDFAFERARAGETKYTAVAGTLELRRALCSQLQTDYGLTYTEAEVCVGNGGKQAIFHFLQSVLEPEDEVIFFKPYWTSFPEMVKLAGAKPVLVGNRKGRPDLEAFEKAITKRTRAFILNSPSNPSGSVWTKEELEKAAEILEPHPIWILSDDTYYQLVYEPAKFVNILQLRPSFRDRVCIVGSTSKSYAMTGWRLGWAFGPSHLIQAMVKIQGQVTSGASSVSQAGALAAVTKARESALEFKQLFARRRALVLKTLKAYGWDSYAPEGAFYCFIELKSKIPASQTVTAFCEDLLEKTGVCLVPGEAFGEPDFVRLSYALAEAEIERGLGLVKSQL